jgi:hypothetical protein
MFDIRESLGKVVTAKTASGLEIVGLVKEVDSTTIILTKPRVVVVSNSEIALVPYTFTSDADTPILRSLILSVVLTEETTASDYLSVTELLEGNNG